MKIKKILPLLVFAFPSLAYSQNLVEFQAGSPARAADVNQNFRTLQNSISELKNEILSLTAQIELIKNPQVTGSAILGRYSVIQTDSLVKVAGSASPANPTGTYTNSADLASRVSFGGSMTLESGGTFTGNRNSTETRTSTSYKENFSKTEVKEADGTTAYFAVENGRTIDKQTETLGIYSGSWSLSGNTLLLGEGSTLGSDAAKCSVSLDSRIIVCSGHSSSANSPGSNNINSAETNFFILIRS